MSTDPQFLVGLLAAGNVLLLLGVFFLNRGRQELISLRELSTAQRTTTQLAESRAQSLEQEVLSLNKEVAALSAQLSAHSATLAERETSHQNQMKWLETSRAALRSELEVVGQKLLASSGKALESTNQKSLDSLLKPLAEKIDQFQARVNQVHTDMVRNSASLSEQIKHLESVGVSMSDEAHNLTRALKGDKKLVGNWGEAQLEKTLELAGLRRGEHYDAQVTVKDSQGDRHVPDFVIRLPEGKNLVVDSKVSLVDYERAVTAESDSERASALQAHAKAVRSHIDTLSAKDYANLPGMDSPDFVLMFMPVEPAYIEVMRSQRELFNHGYQKNVVLVSHTTLMPILRTVTNLWMIEHSNREAREISDRAGDIYNTVCLLGDRLQALGSSMNTATQKYNETVRAVQGKQGLAGKVARFQTLSKKANKTFPKALGPIEAEIEPITLDSRRSQESDAPAAD